MRTIRNCAVFALGTAMALSPFSRTVLAAEDVLSPTRVPSQAAAVPGPALNLNSQRLLEATGRSTLVEPSFSMTAASDVAAQRRGYRGGGSYGGRRAAAAQALFIGAAAAITGAAVLAYANRPECNYNPYASACGYGTKVIGTSVLAGGVVGVMVGAALWH